MLFCNPMKLKWFVPLESLTSFHAEEKCQQSLRDWTTCIKWWNNAEVCQRSIDITACRFCSPAKGSSWQYWTGAADNGTTYIYIYMETSLLMCTWYCVSSTGNNYLARYIHAYMCWIYVSCATYIYISHSIFSNSLL